VKGDSHERIFHPPVHPGRPRLGLPVAPNLPAGFTARAMKPAADDVQTVVIPGAGHWVAEQAPEELLATLTAFLAPYRDRG
jgi:pimeloyl-ACP methyl ester carboxylesterase